MNIAVVGTGYVGLVTGTCFAETGNNVICVDIDEQKVARMRNGEVPIFEPGLDLLFARNTKQGRLEAMRRGGLKAKGAGLKAQGLWIEGVGGETKDQRSKVQGE